MLKNEREINYMVGLAGKGNDQHRIWTGIQINFWPLVHPWIEVLTPVSVCMQTKSAVEWLPVIMQQQPFSGNMMS